MAKVNLTTLPSAQTKRVKKSNGRKIVDNEFERRWEEVTIYQSAVPTQHLPKIWWRKPSKPVAGPEFEHRFGQQP
jgi:hypothetical protein